MEAAAFVVARAGRRSPMSLAASGWARGRESLVWQANGERYPLSAVARRSVEVPYSRRTPLLIGANVALCDGKPRGAQSPPNVL